MPESLGTPSRAADAPHLSIVIASVNGRPYLDACLDALAGQQGEVSAEVIVADCTGAETQDYVRVSHPGVRLLAFDEAKSVPTLRAAGIQAARGEIVVITEDHCIPAPDWYHAIHDAHRRRPEPAIGGVVDNAATARSIDWAVFFCEYSNFMSPMPAGSVSDLPGPNVSYKRSALDAMSDLIRDAYWETFLHDRLIERGFALWSDPQIRVLHKKHFRFGSFFHERFHYGRAFAGHRNRFMSRGRRLAYWLLSPALPPILMLRIGRRVARRGRYHHAFLRALPLITLFMVAWAAGEWTGYASGPGKSELQLT